MITKKFIIISSACIVIVGVTTVLALAYFHCNCSESAEKAVLKDVFSAQRTFYDKNGRYADIGTTLRSGDIAPELQLEISPSFRYTLTINADSTGYICTATGNLDDDATLDIIAVDATGHLWVVSDDVVR